MMDPIAASGLTAFASALLHSLWQNALLCAAAALALRAMARASAASRHNVGMLFLLAMVLVPALQFLSLWRQSYAGIDAYPLPWGPSFGATRNIFGVETSSSAFVVVVLWLLGVVLMLVRHAGGLRAIALLERDPHEALPPHWQVRVDELRRALGIARVVVVRLSRDVLAPCTARLVRPVIWLPLSLLTHLSAAQLEALLAHELAHIARKDWLWNRVQCVVESVLFFHPGVWWLGKRIRQEREHACDDLAVVACGDPIALAEALAELERERHSAPRLALAAREGRLMQRVVRLLSGPPSRARRTTLTALGAVVILGTLLIVQIAISAGEEYDLLVRASTSGDALGRGDFREIHDKRFGTERFYRASVDEQGRLAEEYREDGQLRPIDAGVRRWIEDPRIILPPPR